MKKPFFSRVGFGGRSWRRVVVGILRLLGLLLIAPLLLWQLETALEINSETTTTTMVDLPTTSKTTIMTTVQTETSKVIIEYPPLSPIPLPHKEP